MGGAPRAAGRSDELLTVERVAVLQRVPMFSAVPGHTLAALARMLEEVRVPDGTTFIERGQLEDWLYVVAEGKVRVHIGTRVLVDRGPGDIIGELAVLAPAPRSASVTALEPSLLLKLRRLPFDEILEDRPEMARAVMAALADRLQQLANRDAAELPG